MCVAGMHPRASWIRCRCSIRSDRSRGASPSSILTSASASASTGRPFGRPLMRLPRNRDVSTITESFIRVTRARFALSFQKVAILLDVHGEIERVLPHEPFGKLRVATLERFDDAHVVDDRACGA